MSVAKLYGIPAVVAVSSFAIGWFTGRKDIVGPTKISAPPAPIYTEDDVEKLLQPANKRVASVLSRTQEIMRYGFPSLDNVRTFDDFVLAYDRRLRIPSWVFEHLTKDKVNYNPNVDRSNSDFSEDPSIPSIFRATNNDYKRSGYDRGHLAAAANHKGDQTHCNQTFFLSNIAPQVGAGFNRDYWAKLEGYVRKLARQNLNVYVVTGPLFLPQPDKESSRKYVKYEVIGDNNVAVPTHFFKVILIEKSKNNFELESYVLPNAKIPEEMPFQKFYVPINAIESASGLLLFDKIPKDKLSRINGAKTSLF